MLKTTSIIFLILVISYFLPIEYRQNQDNEQIPVCLKKSDVKGNIGRKVRVIGTCRIQYFYGKKNTLIRNWPVVRMNDSSEAMIGSLWISKEALDSVLLNRFIGKTVSVTGLLHGQPPGSIQNILFPCISPVSGIEILKDEE